MDTVLVAFGALLTLGFLVAVVLAVARWRGVRRLLAILVVLLIAAHAIKVAVDLQREASSHNLWPFEVVMVAAGALVVLGVLALARPRARASAPDSGR